MASPLRRAPRADLIAAVALFAAGSVLIGLGSFEPYRAEVPLAMRFVPPALVCLGVTVRRAAPGWCLALGVAGFGTEVAVGFTLVTVCVFTDNLYSYARYGPRSRTRFLIGGAGAAIAVFVVWAFSEGSDAGGVISTAAVAAVVLVSPIGTAIIVRQAHDRASLEAERAEQTARLADVRRREAVLRERTSMARELHDTVANYLSAIALQSTGLQARHDLDEETVKRSVAAIRQSSVEGLAELRRIIGLLRTPDAAEELASYRLEQIPELVERMRRVGLKVDYTADGPDRKLTGEVETAAFRVVQEALTNALKYGTDASVAVAYGPERLTVAVENTVDSEADPVPSGGAGLVGMSERVRLLGGSLRAGPDGGRWRVSAEIPTEGNAI
ncbi:histidine kinase [Glycomyces sp. L485]|uniref:sensor histidine kinase n=1 Tax=Glycomyces sp. L485 TaxID=2909235 RepID=UPI001F4A6158|nr:histidine kinase [Glycomyces sp. L485]MCH7230227.1 histidine kinase [Glycomyces sp. L485]